MPNESVNQLFRTNITLRIKSNSDIFFYNMNSCKPKLKHNSSSLHRYLQSDNNSRIWSVNILIILQTLLSKSWRHKLNKHSRFKQLFFCAFFIPQAAMCMRKKQASWTFTWSHLVSLLSCYHTGLLTCWKPKQTPITKLCILIVLSFILNIIRLQY